MFTINAENSSKNTDLVQYPNEQTLHWIQYQVMNVWLHLFHTRSM